MDVISGLTEIRICEIGDAKAVRSLVTELRLKHDEEDIVGVKIENLITKEEVNAEVIWITIFIYEYTVVLINRFWWL